MRPPLPSEGRAGVEGVPAIVVAGDDTTALCDHDKPLGLSLWLPSEADVDSDLGGSGSAITVESWAEALPGHAGTRRAAEPLLGG